MTIKREIKASILLAAVAVLFAIGTLIVSFHRQPISNDISQWGQLGDYIGGLLNPLFAFLAFYWLTRSIILQKQELEETRLALRDSATALETQLKYAERGARINALSAILTSIDSELAVTQSNVHHLKRELMDKSVDRLEGGAKGFIHQFQRSSTVENIKETIVGLEQHLESLLKQRTEVIAEIRQITSESIT